MSESSKFQEGARQPIKIGVIGAGNVLWAYLGVMDRMAARGYCVGGPVFARRRDTWPRLLSLRPNLELVADVKAVVESDVDVVVVITAPDTHPEYTTLALKHHKHVVVEKPLALTCAEALPVVRLAAERQLNLVIAPFVQLSPTFRALWNAVNGGAIGRPHSARGLYGNGGGRAIWHYRGGVGPLAEKGIYNLKSLTALLGPVSEVLAVETTAIAPRFVRDVKIADPEPDVSFVTLRHRSGAISSIVSSDAIQRYRRPGLEIYGTEGTANLLGDDWDPRGYEIWRNAAGRWEEYEPIESTWHWADGLREAVMALWNGQPPRVEHDHDLHILDVIDSARRAAKQASTVPVTSHFKPLAWGSESARTRHHVHDHTRPEDEQ